MKKQKNGNSKNQQMEILFPEDWESLKSAVHSLPIPQKNVKAFYSKPRKTYRQDNILSVLKTGG